LQLGENENERRRRYIGGLGGFGIMTKVGFRVTARFRTLILIG
jgi:hypothetical protein